MKLIESFAFYEKERNRINISVMFFFGLQILVHTPASDPLKLGLPPYMGALYRRWSHKINTVKGRSWPRFVFRMLQAMLTAQVDSQIRGVTFCCRLQRSILVTSAQVLLVDVCFTRVGSVDMIGSPKLAARGSTSTPVVSSHLLLTCLALPPMM